MAYTGIYWLDEKHHEVSAAMQSLRLDTRDVGGSQDWPTRHMLIGHQSVSRSSGQSSVYRILGVSRTPYVAAEKVGAS
jgi:hypothetical protein